jgi:hypothetical protein
MRGQRSIALCAGMGLLAVTAAAQTLRAQGLEAGSRDPFRELYGNTNAPAAGDLETFDPGAQSGTGFGPTWPQAAESADRSGERGPVTVETTHPNLLGGEPMLDDESGGTDDGFPPGTVPTQYPLDDDAYRGLPEALPGDQPPSWAPPIIGGPSDEDCDGGECDARCIAWKSGKAALSHVLGGGSSFGITTLDVRGTLEFPRWPGVFVTPQFGWHFLSGPSSTDVPPRLYDASLDVSLWRPVGEAWLLQFSLAPSLFTDGENTSSDMLRIIGRFMAYYTVSPMCQLVGGIVYLDRQDVPVLPAAGVIYTPREDLRYELLFPKPRIAWRQYFNASWQQWAYVTGELGGGSWAVQRTGGGDDIFTYRDLRFVLGVERKMTAGHAWYAEGGYVFGREIEYESDIGNRSLSDTAFVRVGASF